MASADSFVYRARDALLVMAGAGAILLGTAYLVFGTGASSRDPVRDFGMDLLVGLVIAAGGGASLAIGLVRAMFQLPVEQLPSTTRFGAVALGGLIALLLVPSSIFRWITLYSQTDPRSHPSHVFGATVFFGSFATAIAVAGAAIFLSRLARGRHPQGTLADT